MVSDQSLQNLPWSFLRSNMFQVFLSKNRTVHSRLFTLFRIRGGDLKRKTISSTIDEDYVC
jgi:hypothetical protein